MAIRLPDPWKGRTPTKQECLEEFAAICAPAYRRWKEKQLRSMMERKQAAASREQATA